LKTRVNSDIIARRVLLIGGDGSKVGIFQTRDAISKAQEAGLDLLQVSADQEVPVCKIVDYGKMLYLLKKGKKAKGSRVVVKEVKFGPNTGDADIQVRVKAANKFLSKGNHVKFTVRVKGRANAHRDLVIDKLAEVLEKVEGKVEKAPSFSGNICSALVVPE
jgi:translation initiation factor IF-3